MADLDACAFAGGSAGAAVTPTTEPFFTSKTGTVVYAATTSGEMGMQPSSSGTGQMFRAPADGRTKYGYRWKSEFLSSTATTAFHYTLGLRNSTTNRCDVGFRNASGSRHAAARNNFTYIGEATGNTSAANQVWAFDVVIDATSFVVRVWEDATSLDLESPLSSPTYSWSATLAVQPDNGWFGPDVNTGVSQIIYDIHYTDGVEPIVTGAIAANAPTVTVDVPTSSWSGTSGGAAENGAIAATAPTVSAAVPTSAWSGTVVPPPGTLTRRTNATATDDLIKVASQVADALVVRLEVTPTAGGTTVVGANATPAASGYVQPFVDGLSAGTEYDYEIFVDGVSRATGTSVKTLPMSGTHTLLLGSCFDSNSSGVFDLMAARGADVMVLPGDLQYTWLTSGSNGNTSPTDEATLRSHRETSIGTSGEHLDFLGNINVQYIPSDTDGAGANSDSTTGGNSTGAAQAVYREMWAHPDLPVAGCGARSWVVGKRRFVYTDETSLASDRDAMDNSSKLKLGTTQQAWFFDELDAAAAAGQVVIWIGDGPWQRGTSAGGSTNNTWGAYNTNRVAIQAKIAAAFTAGMRGFFRWNGDDHNLGLDSGANNPWGGFPLLNAAPLHTTAQVSGHTFDLGEYPTAASINGARHYAHITTTEDADNVYVQVKGYSSTSGAPTEVQRFGSASDGSDTDGHTFTFSLAVGGSIAANTPTVNAAVPTSSWSGTADVPVFAGAPAADTPVVAVAVPTSAWTGAATVPVFTGAAVADTPVTTIDVPTSAWAGTVSAPGAIVGDVVADAPGVAVAVPTSAWVGAYVPVFAGTVDAITPAVDIAAPSSTWPGTTTIPVFLGAITATIPEITIASPTWTGVGSTGNPPPTGEPVFRVRTTTGMMQTAVRLAGGPLPSANISSQSPRVTTRS